MKIKNILANYGQIYFSKQWLVGAFFLGATFVVPSQGIAGISSMILSNKIAGFFKLSGKLIDDGYFAYNGMLVGLALSMVYAVNLLFLPLFLTAVFLSVFVSDAISRVWERHLNVPALSLPFVITSWAVLRAASRFPALNPATKPFEGTALNDFFHPAFEYFLRTIGAAFFSFSIPAGLLVFLGLLIYSRQALLLAAIGVSSVALTQHLLGFSYYPPDGGWLGFNSVLTAIALGGIFIAPGPGSFALAWAGAFTCALVTSASVATLPILGLPVLAFPFVATTTVILYGLNQRIENRPFTVLQTQGTSPEENSRQFLNMELRNLSTAIPAFYIPVKGPWTITQGFNGTETHMGQWCHALDFEVTDKDGSTYKNGGLSPEDFYACNLPVYAPASGQVVNIVDNLPNNPIGQVNCHQNWGNLVVIAHRGGVYSLLCHLAPKTIKVKMGDYVQAGEPLGKVGSSGRSPVPHLHFQVQLSPEPGAPTIPVDLLHYLIISGSDSEYITRGIPQKNQIIQSLIHDNSRSRGGSFPLGQSWSYEIKIGQEIFIEEWKSTIDFSGSRFLRESSSGNSLRVIIDDQSLITGPYKGTAISGLKWFALGVPRMPFTTKNAFWCDELSPELLLTGALRSFNNIIEPYAPVARLKTKSKFISCQGCTVSTDIKGEGLLRLPDSLTVTSSFEKDSGLVSLVARTPQRELCSLKLLQ
jgi:urea transporter